MNPIVNTVKRFLDERFGTGATDVLVNAVRQDEDWWYVPVIRASNPADRFAYYQELSEVENDIEQAEHVNVLLIPAS